MWAQIPPLKVAFSAHLGVSTDSSADGVNQGFPMEPKGQAGMAL